MIRIIGTGVSFVALEEVLSKSFNGIHEDRASSASEAEPSWRQPEAAGGGAVEVMALSKYWTKVASLGKQVSIPTG